ncbi:MAG: iron-containing redox enzyme family protein [Actinobacteria bacterium]|nr:MAG: iron-containing redox enzyme family protein [Actinomycetota bacterium]
MRLPEPRGPLSEALVARLRREPGVLGTSGRFEVGDPLSDDDLHLSLYVCYELHYRGFAGVDERWEWEPTLIAFRSALERPFEDGLREAIGRQRLAGSVEDALKHAIDTDASPSMSRHFEERGTLAQFREFVVHRSAYQLKEADPHSWAIPRLDGAPKAAMVEIQSEEYGSGKPEAMHAELFRTTMRGLGLDDAYGAYLEHLPGSTLATVNLMSLFGLHRRLRGAIVGHLAAFEMTSTSPNARYAAALRRMGAPASVIAFYDEHVEADADHEIVAARGMAGGLIAAEPALFSDVLFGAAALLHLEGRFAARLFDAWNEGRSSLRLPLDDEGTDGGHELRPAVALAGRR